MLLILFDCLVHSAVYVRGLWESQDHIRALLQTRTEMSGKVKIRFANFAARSHFFLQPSRGHAWRPVTCLRPSFLHLNFPLSALLSQRLCIWQRTHFKEYVIKPKACSCERGWITVYRCAANTLWHLLCLLGFPVYLTCVVSAKSCSCFRDEINIAKGFTFAISKCHVAVAHDLQCAVWRFPLGWVIKNWCLIFRHLF